MKTNKKTKSEENEYWLDELLEQTENHRVEPDGSTLYGYEEEPKLFSQGWWLNTKNAIVMVWAAKNPFYENAKFESGCAAADPVFIERACQHLGIGVHAVTDRYRCRTAIAVWLRSYIFLFMQDCSSLVPSAW